jgi:muramoyltetrapeptide carboxypeptidase
MIGTPFDLPYDGNILFIEEIAEKPYHIDRMMQNLRLSGALAKISGLVVGQFSYCDEDPLMKMSIAEIIADAVKEYHFPVCFNFPAGHVDYNLPLVLGEEVEMDVLEKEFTICC